MSMCLFIKKQFKIKNSKVTKIKDRKINLNFLEEIIKNLWTMSEDMRKKKII